MFKHIVMKSTEIKGTFPRYDVVIANTNSPFLKIQTGAMTFGSQSMLYLWVVVTFSETREIKLEPILDRKCPESSGPGADFPDLFATICPVEGTD